MHRKPSNRAKLLKKHCILEDTRQELLQRRLLLVGCHAPVDDALGVAVLQRLCQLHNVPG